MRSAIAVLALGVVLSSCRRSQPPGPPTVSVDSDGDGAAADAGELAEPADAGGQDAQSPPARTCPATPRQDTMSWQSGTAATTASVDGGAWSRISDAQECSTLVPLMPTTALTWQSPTATASCDPAAIDGAGDLAIYSLDGTAEGVNLVSASGGPPRFVAYSNTDRYSVVAPFANGFGLIRLALPPTCQYGGVSVGITPPSSLAWIDGPTSWVTDVVPDRKGGYVEVRKQFISDKNPYSLQLRWVDANLQPRSDWQVAMMWPGGTENEWVIRIDEFGRAFVLSFVYPESFGAPPDPSMWTFSARWVDANGAIGDAFAPIAPTFTAPNGKMYFANWDVVTPLREGGVAAYHWPYAGPGALSHSGWYAYYPSGKSAAVQPPAWLDAYDGSLNVVAGGNAYVALTRDATTCARTVSLISSSGTACYALRLPGSDVCGTADRVQADGTIVLQSNCLVRWWPRAVSLSQ